MLTLPAREHASNTVGAGRDSPPPAAVARPAEPGTSAIPATQPPLHQVQHCCGTRQWRCSSGKIPGRRQPAPPWTPSPPGTIHSGPPNPTLHLMQRGLELKPGHPSRAASSRSPPRREGRDELKPPAAFRVAARRTQLRRPRPGAISDLDPDGAVLGPERDRDRLPRSARAAMPDRITKHLADQQGGILPARMPVTEYLRDERAGGPCPLRPPGKRHALPDRHPGHHRTRPSPAASPRETGRAAGGRRDMHAQLRRTRQADATGSARTSSVARPWLRPRPWPSVKQPTVRTDRPSGTRARPLCVRGCRNNPVHNATR